METYNLTRELVPTEKLIALYNKLQNNPWGKSSIVKGYYFIANIEKIASPIPTREQGLANCYWKMAPEEYYNSDVMFNFLLGALFNSSSIGPHVKMNELLGKIILVTQVRAYNLEGKNRFSITWDIIDELFFIPDDVVYDEFYREMEDDHILLDKFNQEKITEGETGANDIYKDDEPEM